MGPIAMLVTLSGSGALYQQVYRAIREAILAGRLRAGYPLPVSRTLARHLSVSRIVVLIAYDLLVSEGYAVGRVGAGTFVAAVVPDSMTQVRPSGRSNSSGNTPAAPHLSQYAQRILADTHPDRWFEAPIRR